MKFELSLKTDDIFLPVIYSLASAEGKQQHEKLLSETPGIVVIDHFEQQRREWINTRNLGKKQEETVLDNLYRESLAGLPEAENGLWVYYPWLNKLVHIIGENDFFELRTNRNCYKITPAEQQQLAKKTIGVIGLSVGHAVAVCLATERVCGHIKLADFDILELSNLNRVYTSLVNLGINKAVATARAIAEIDPFIRVEVFTQGIYNHNLESFICGLDILVDECDSIDIKIACRLAAKRHRIPVVMETSDRGMLDVERFDREPGQPVLHGLVEGIDLEGIHTLTAEQKVPLVLRIADVNHGSVRGKASMLEVGRSISTWPQLASAVTLGGAVVTDVCRRILLNEYHESGRHYIDIESIAGDKIRPDTEDFSNPFPAFKWDHAIRQLDALNIPEGKVAPEESELEQMIGLANLAPSTGNDQPWKWIFTKNTLVLFHDRQRSFSFGDFDHIASDISFGAAVENLRLAAFKFGYAIHTEIFPSAANPEIICIARFSRAEDPLFQTSVFKPSLADFIERRNTNRNASQPVSVPENHLQSLKTAVCSVEGARLHLITARHDILSMGRIIGSCDRVRLLNEKGHQDFVAREMRWTPQSASESRDGIDIRTLGLTPPFVAALSIIKDARVAAALKKIDGARALVDAALATVATASLLGVITLPVYSRASFFNGGIAMERAWLQATELGYAVHPLISPFYLFPRITKGGGAGLDEKESAHLTELRKQFKSIVPVNDDDAEVLIFKLAVAPEPGIKSLRLPIEDTFQLLNIEVNDSQDTSI